MTNSEFKIQLEKRTVAFSVAVIKMLRKIPGGLESKNIRVQVMRSATAVGANYREANRAESSADFRTQDWRGCEGGVRKRILDNAAA